MVLGHINGYNTTEDFVKALSEHMKISTYCSADRIADCFPYDKINIDGECRLGILAQQVIFVGLESPTYIYHEV